MEIPWAAVFDSLPDGKNAWYVEFLNWSHGGMSLGGSISVHNRSSFAEMRFEGVDAKALAAIKRTLLLPARNVFRNSINPRTNGDAERWSDPVLGDQAFYLAKVKPLVEELKPFADRISRELTDAEVVEIKLRTGRSGDEGSRILEFQRALRPVGELERQRQVLLLHGEGQERELHGLSRAELHAAVGNRHRDLLARGTGGRDHGGGVRGQAGREGARQVGCPGGQLEDGQLRGDQVRADTLEGETERRDQGMEGQGDTARRVRGDLRRRVHVRVVHIGLVLVPDLIYLLGSRDNAGDHGLVSVGKFNLRVGLGDRLLCECIVGFHAGSGIQGVEIVVTRPPVETRSRHRDDARLSLLTDHRRLTRQLIIALGTFARRFAQDADPVIPRHPVDALIFRPAAHRIPGLVHAAVLGTRGGSSVPPLRGRTELNRTSRLVYL